MGIVNLHLNNSEAVNVDVLVMETTPLGFPFTLGMNGIVAMGRATVDKERRVRFGKKDVIACVAGVAAIGVDEQDFSATYDTATNSWTATWKWSQDDEPGALRNQVEECLVPERCTKTN
ncbi:hypothetical protein E2C01_050606 [Portunus trituberculatus]|uniref:Uncharacterized protein n=1 Tax=Portunus trituberculatus TaxID=210409 RepID=A0A5B7G9G2_PORTR|nr:hypothetical protein [Portunus trituberculatus]